MKDSDEKPIMHSQREALSLYQSKLVSRGIQLANDTFESALRRKHPWSNSPAAQLRGHFIHKRLAEDGFQSHLGRGFMRQVYPVDDQRVLIVTLAGAGLYHWSSGREEWQIDCLNGDAKLSPKYRYLALSNTCGAGTSLWDLRDAREILIPCKDRVHGIAFDKDETKLAIGSNTGVVIHDLATHNTYATVKTRDEHCQGVCFNSSGQLLAVSTSAGNVQVWDTSLGLLLTQNPVGDEDIVDLAFSENDEYLAGGGSNAFYAWRVEPAGKALIPWMEHPYVEEGCSHPSCIVITPTNHCVAAWEGDSHWEMWDLESRSRVRQPSVNTPAFTLIATSYIDAGQLYIAGTDGSSALLWNHTSGEVVQQLELPGHHHRITALQLLGDDQTLISADEQGVVMRWDITEGTPTEILWRSDAGVAALQSVTDRQELIIVSHRGTVETISVEDGSLLRRTRLAAPLAPTTRCWVSNNGRRLGIIANDGASVLVYALADGELEWEIGAQCDPVYSLLAFSADGAMLAITSGANYSDILIYNLDAKSAFLISVDGKIYGLAFAPDCSELCVATQTSVAGYHLKTRDKRWEHTHSLLDYCTASTLSTISLDGTLFARKGNMQCLWIYDLQAHDLVRVVSGLFSASPSGACNAAALSKRHRLVAIGSGLGMIQLFKLDETMADAKKNAQDLLIVLTRSDSTLGLNILRFIQDEPDGPLAQLLAETSFVEEALAGSADNEEFE